MNPVLRLQEDNRELWIRYRALQDALIEAVDNGDWSAIHRLAHNQRKRQELETVRFFCGAVLVPSSQYEDEGRVGG